MLALQATEGEGLGNPSEPQPLPSAAQPTHEEPIPNIESSSPQKTQSPRQALNKDTGVLALEIHLRQTKKVYGTAYTKPIIKVKKLEKTIKTSQAKRRAKIVVLDDDMASEDSSKQGRRVSTADLIQQVNIIIPSSSATKDKDKAIMTESKPEKTTTKLKQRQERAGYEAAIRLQEQLNKEETQRVARDAKVAQRLQEEIDAAEKQRMAQVHQAA
ncbi:hypothetical protein Tco_0408024 [Tanacetum coccineum]